MATPGATPVGIDAKPAYTLRVTFAYRGEKIELAGSRRVRMIAPPPVAAAPEKGQSGYWFEVRDAAGKLLFHRAVHNPVRVDVEVFANDRKQSITRVPIAEPHGEFEVLVPDLPAAASFVLHGPPANVEMQGAPAQPLVTLGFDELRRASGDTPTREGR